ncbi:MAG: peptidylprolyl isomerase [Patescibacteria group bacterium]|nr:peptidylprolyl isomerase [Patescibacteria group bacterium]
MAKKIIFFSLFILISFSLSGCASKPAATSQNEEQKNTGENRFSRTRELNNEISDKKPKKTNMPETFSSPQDLSYKDSYDGAVIHTSLGDIKVAFCNEKAPLTVNNFLKLADDNFYDRTLFHRIIEDFMIQAGDPVTKNKNSRDRWGTGGPGYTFQDETSDEKLIKGSLAMANSGPNTNGSQFFIVTTDAVPWLDGKHTNFGKVTEGMDVVEKIEKMETNAQDQPIEDILINSVELIKKQEKE